MTQTNKLVAQLTQNELKELRSNFNINNERSAQGDNVKAFKPVVKLFNPTGRGTWYLSELSPDHMGFGICQLNETELGYVSLKALNALRLPFGLSIEKDITFSANGQNIYQLLETLQTGINASDEQQSVLPTMQKDDRIYKKATNLVEHHILAQQTDLVELCLREDIIPYDYIVNSHHECCYHEEKDVYSLHLITDWLAEKLEAKYEPILACRLGTWWGRTTFGQPIMQDGVIQEIAEACL